MWSSRYADPAAAGLVALVVYALHGFHGTLSRDQGTFVYGGIRFAHGVPPYRGIFNSVGPLGDMASGAGTRLGWLVGLDAVTGARVFFLLLSAGCVAALSVLAREALGSRVAGLLAPAVFLTFADFSQLATDGPREKTITVLSLEIAMVLLLRRRWLGAGVGTALATLAWQPAVLPLVAAAAVAILTTPSRRLRAAARYVAGGLLPTALLAAYFVLAGAAQVAYWGFVRVNVGYTSQPHIVESWHLLTVGYGWTLALVVAGWAVASLCTLVGLVALRRADGAEPGRPLLVLGTPALVGGLWSCYAINGGPDLFVVLPFSALGIAGVVEVAARRIAAASAARWCAALAALAVVVAATHSVTTRDDLIHQERRNVEAMVAALPRGSTVLSLSAPEVLVLAHRTNPYTWQLSNEAMSAFFDDHLAGGLPGYADRIKRLHPALIAVGLGTVDDWLRPVLRHHYTKIGRGSHWVWWGANSLGPQTIRRLESAHAATWPG